MLTRIRNALMVEHDTVSIPASKVKSSMAGILKEEGFIRDFEVIKSKPQDTLRLHLRYDENRDPMIQGLKRVSKPGLRVYVRRNDIPRVFAGLGIAIVSTSKGIMTGRKAWREGAGGELLCYVW
jgi:small subunit ribosomal protein S8